MKYEQPGLWLYAQVFRGEWGYRLHTRPAEGETFQGFDGSKTDAENEAKGWFKVANAEPPEFDPEIQFCLTTPRYLVMDGKPVADWDLRPLTEEDRESRREAMRERLRTTRDARLDESDWIVRRHRDQVEAGIAATLTEEQFQAVLTYRQALRDWPGAAAAASSQTELCQGVKPEPPARPDFI